jgi:hypothetical protein
MTRMDIDRPRAADVEHAARVRAALGDLVAPPDGRPGGQRDRREALGACVVALVELTAATQILVIHLRLSGELDVSGLAASRGRVHAACATLVRHQVAALRAIAPPVDPDDWVDAVVRSAAAALGRWAALPGPRLEAFGRLVARPLAEAVAAPGAQALPLVRSTAQALALYVLTADPPARGGRPERPPTLARPAP